MVFHPDEEKLLYIVIGMPLVTAPLRRRDMHILAREDDQGEQSSVLACPMEDGRIGIKTFMLTNRLPLRYSGKSVNISICVIVHPLSPRALTRHGMALGSLENNPLQNMSKDADASPSDRRWIDPYIYDDYTLQNFI